MHSEPVRGALIEAYRQGVITRRDLIAGAFRLGLSVSGAAALLAACSSGGSGATTTTARPSGTSRSGSPKLSGTVQVLVGFGVGNEPNQVAVQQALAQAFMRQHPDVTISFLRVTGGSTNAGTKLTTLIAGGAAPDIAIPVGVYGISLFLDQDVWLDLAPYLSRDGVSLSSFLPASRPAVHVPAYFGAGSSAVIGLPIGVNDHALAYNEELFSRAGVAPPPSSWTDPSWTLEPGGKMLQTATALTRDAKGRHPGEAGFDPSKIVQFGLANFFRHTVYYDFGAHLYDPSTRKAQFDTPEAVAGLQFAADLVNKYHVMPSTTQLAALGAGDSDPNEGAWRSGKVAMIDMCTCNIKTPYGMNVPFSWKAAAMPAGPRRRFCFLNLDVGAIVKPSKNHDLAWEVLKYLTLDPVPEAKLAYQSDGAIPPLRSTSSQFSSGIHHDLPNVDPGTWIAGLPYSSEENEQWIPAFAEVNDLEGKAFDQVSAGTPAATVMPKLAARAQAQIDQWFKTHHLPSG